MTWTNRFQCNRIQKFIGIVLDSTSKLTFKKLPLIDFGVASKKNIYNYLKTGKICYFLVKIKMFILGE